MAMVLTLCGCAVACGWLVPSGPAASVGCGWGDCELGGVRVACGVIIACATGGVAIGVMVPGAGECERDSTTPWGAGCLNKTRPMSATRPSASKNDRKPVKALGVWVSFISYLLRITYCVFIHRRDAESAEFLLVMVIVYRPSSGLE